MKKFLQKWLGIYSNNLNRTQFLVNIVVIYAVYMPLMLLDFDRKNPPSWLLVIGGFLGVYLLFVIFKRAQDCTEELKLRHFLLMLIPGVNGILLISLFFLPSKKK